MKPNTLSAGYKCKANSMPALKLQGMMIAHLHSHSEKMRMTAGKVLNNATHTGEIKSKRKERVPSLVATGEEEEEVCEF